ncbi:class V lanthionine synthetase subunit LxmK [Lentzea sp. NBRC 102530]|uniref:class V lanthionine synthetase subunit LxmK n=1 Tax=Lentzea sp. NBRC 102530 TaxID=3032201 RepID=UPI0025578842|nr:class V lanthionine synthetase subunit LxmK [Lentzea sp. NBRC 102530]
MHEIDSLLDRLGLGTLDWQAATTVVGRNDNWLGTTTTGERVFVKRIVGTPAEVTSGLRRTAAFYRCAGPILSPALLGQDEDSAVQAFRGLDDVRTGEKAALDRTFDVDLGAQAGKALASVHRLDPGPLAETEQALPEHPHEDVFGGISAEMYTESSQAQLQAWHLVQQDDVIVRSLAPLEDRGADVVRTPTHGDLRLDQFLIADHGLHLADWETFRLADPARDVGSFVGEFLYHAIFRHLADRTRAAARRVPVPNIVLTERWQPYREVRPVVEAFWQAYHHARPSPDVAERAVVFVAWHLLDRMFIDAMARPRLDGVGHTLFRIARTILVAPHRFHTTLGLARA